MKRLETRLEGPILVEPVVHGDHRGFFHETYRKNVYAELGHPRRLRPGQPLALRAAGSCAACTSRWATAWPSSCAAGAARSSTWWWTSGAARPPSASGRRFELNDENLHQLYCPVGFAHGFCVTSDVADVMYKCSAYYDESIERGIKYDDPEIGIQWPDVELIPSDRDANAPRLSEIADELPFVYEH